MHNKQEKWVCAHCGYTADGKFEGDISTLLDPDVVKRPIHEKKDPEIRAFRVLTVPAPISLR